MAKLRDSKYAQIIAANKASNGDVLTFSIPKGENVQTGEELRILASRKKSMSGGKTVRFTYGTGRVTKVDSGIVKIKLVGKDNDDYEFLVEMPKHKRTRKLKIKDILATVFERIQAILSW